MAGGPSASSERWIRSGPWDTAFLAFAWVPFYVWIASGPLAHARITPEWTHAFYRAALVHAGLNFIHRYYVFLMVYGDKETFAQRRTTYVVASSAVIPVFIALVRFPEWLPYAFLADRLWSVWHSVMQKYGIWRIYAARAGGGLETRAHARRDQLFLFSQYATVLVLVLGWRRETLIYNANVRRLLAYAAPVLSGTCGRVIGSVIVGATLVIALNWTVHELRAQRTGLVVPRWTFLASIVLLYAVSMMHGPLVGQLVFGVSHALEYIAFTNHFGARKYRGANERPSLARWIFHRRVAPVVIMALGGAYLLVRPYEAMPRVLALVLSTGYLHYLYDGWVWKLRKPSVREPLGLLAPSLK